MLWKWRVCCPNRYVLHWDMRNLMFFLQSSIAFVSLLTCKILIYGKEESIMSGASCLLLKLNLVISRSKMIFYTEWELTGCYDWDLKFPFKSRSRLFSHLYEMKLNAQHYSWSIMNSGSSVFILWKTPRVFPFINFVLFRSLTRQ